MYIYCVVPASAPKSYGPIGIGGEAPVDLVVYKDLAAAVSETAETTFERTDENTVAHQLVVHRVFESCIGVPLPFATTRPDREAVKGMLAENYERYTTQLKILGAFGGNAMLTGATGPNELVSEILARSAETALTLRQLSSELESLRRLRYDKAVQHLVKTAAENIREAVSGGDPEVLAKALAGTANGNGGADAGVHSLIGKIQGRMDTLYEQIALMGKDISEKSDRGALLIVDREQRKMLEEISRIRGQVDQVENNQNLQNGNHRAAAEAPAPCGACGSPLEPGVNFCDRCGNRVFPGGGQPAAG